MEEAQVFPILPTEGVLQTLKPLVLKELHTLELQEGDKNLWMLNHDAVHPIRAISYHISEELISLMLIKKFYLLCISGSHYLQ
jgi:hypothetical protein